MFDIVLSLRHYHRRYPHLRLDFDALSPKRREAKHVPSQSRFEMLQFFRFFFDHGLRSAELKDEKGSPLVMGIPNSYVILTSLFPRKIAYVLQEIQN